MLQDGFACCDPTGAEEESMWGLGWIIVMLSTFAADDDEDIRGVGLSDGCEILVDEAES